ncbi:sugar transferase [Carboxylicivirga linearis]|uniref:Sugar transferase n=1 Tax=Carboxylicivirga linearis TaxID=1628157 RepID=A0ABS5K0U7_9BACT|nr:sugar transferase [Carboxylicivirga linearis]MBS2100788.1 sugar transferase [Carboxylicivirga linearis]
MLREKEKVVYNALAAFDVLIAWISFEISLLIHFEQLTFIRNKDSIILHLLILGIWLVLSKALRLNELYRSRPYSILLFNVIVMSALGAGILALSVFVFNLFYIGLIPILYFGGTVAVLMFVEKVLIYHYMKSARRRGLNYRNILIVGDSSASNFINQIKENPEWGYRIIGIIGTEELRKKQEDAAPYLPLDTSVDEILESKTIDEVIYCQEKARMDEIMSLMTSCHEVGVVFRMSSPFFNMLSNKTHLHYFDTTPVLTISNTPMDYLSLKFKAIYDFLVSFSVVTIFSPVYIAIAIGIKLTSKGPIFFKQKRVGIRGRKFWVYKFRTMVTNAEALKKDLMEQNEMDGPTFKMTRDPRITGIGHFLRKTSLDELPQFFNVLLGDMSIVGPRPPVPDEVKEYERWQLRRLSMKPGITCIWQVSSSRNDISFEDWMRMDLEYIDNWSLKLDFVIILKTIRTMFRADGK